MRMRSAPHLLTEDRAEFERLLDEVLRTAHDRPDLSAVGQRLNATQLRTMALNATAVIAGAAAAEYEHYTRIREETRPHPARADGEAASTGRAASAGSTASSASSASEDGGEPDRESGVGLTAVITVLAPVLAGLAALMFLLIGHLLRMLDPPPALATPLITTGWVFAALTAAAILFATMALLRTALRNSATQVEAEEISKEIPEEVTRAKDAWRHALLERGILPFLRAALSDPGIDPMSLELPNPTSRPPAADGPGEGPPAGHRTAFTSPDLTSPDLTGPEPDRPDLRGPEPRRPEPRPE
ncbi:membrane protein [Streptomyces amakusaensis]|uniref:Transmembrane protein n=1 Tax=Streptomyces amakusaensis TaxID=67271 RepID=A0ABW0AGD6_9ACTN